MAPHIGFLPNIYVPFFCLHYFRTREAGDRIAIDYHQIYKDPPPDLTLLQRLIFYKKQGRVQDPILEFTLL